ncbi:MAG: PIN domain-containing protein [Candidatus Nanohaloarchaea archaeon]|nr:PIN domain-containing protein [Candidatus Nanohaloarchaea archaeon]
MKYYIDSNIFVYAASESGGEYPSRALRRVEEGEEAFTSVLTVDEVVWIVQQEAGRDFGVETGRRLMQMRNLYLREPGVEIARQALDLMEKHELDPRDAFHLSTAVSSGVQAVVSEDDDLGCVEGIDLMGAEEFVESA